MIVPAMKVALCAASFGYTFYVLLNFMYFLSSHVDDQRNLVPVKEDEKTFATAVSILLINTALISAFFLQHTAMASRHLKNMYYALHAEDIERSIYNCCCAAVLHFLITNWIRLPWLAVWNIDTSHSTHVWTVMVSIHIIAWFIIYSGCLMMDMAELAGIKQVYYSLSRRPPPMYLKSRELQRFLTHMRHPSFTGFLIIFWVHPVMSVDRLLMAIVMTIYMISMWNIDQRDYDYHKRTILRKKQGLACY